MKTMRNALLAGIFNPMLDRAPMRWLGGVAVSAGWVSFASIGVRFQSAPAILGKANINRRLFAPTLDAGIIVHIAAIPHTCGQERAKTLL